MNNRLIDQGKHEYKRSRAAGCDYSLVQDLYIIQINGFSAFMDDSHKMIAGR